MVIFECVIFRCDSFLYFYTMTTITKSERRKRSRGSKRKEMKEAGAEHER